MYHVLLLLESKGLSLGQVTHRLEARHRSAQSQKRD
jgi:phosphoribosyl-ATP pyrophosphohydrolase